MKILLIIPHTPTVYGQPEMPRLGIAYLSGSLQNNGLEHDILDLNLYPEWEKELQERAEIYSVFGITSTTFEFENAKKIARLIKKWNPQGKILLGGPHATALGKEILETCEEIDFCCSGEGELCFSELARVLESGQEVQGIDNLYFRLNKSVKCNDLVQIHNIDDLPFPFYEKFELNKYPSFPYSCPILTSRGCPFQCIYCSVGKTMGKYFRARSPQNVLDEMESLIKKYGISHFSLSDDNFTVDIERAKEICKGMIDRRLNVKYSLSNGIRADRIDDELLSLMKKSGCVEIAIGIESIHDKILKRIKKGSTRKIYEKAISQIQKYKIPLKVFFLIGSPGEKRDDIKDYVKFAKEKGVDVARFGMLVPYPNSELWNWIEENGYWLVDDPLTEVTKYTDIGQVKALYETPCFSKKDKEMAYKEAWNEWEEYVSKRNIRGRVRHILKKHPYVYNRIKSYFFIIKKIRHSLRVRKIYARLRI